MFNHDISLIEIAFHWPHNRFALGWQVLLANDEEDYWSLDIFLGIMTITYNNV